MATAAAPAQQAPKKELTIRERLNSPGMIAELGRAMPSHCKPDRMARVALTALTKTPKLAECTQASFFECLLNLSQWGLEPDGRRAYLIPYGKVCTLIISYMGYVELAYRSGFVKSIHADLVREGDLFEYSLGDVVNHVPHYLRRDVNKPAQAGNVFAVYCRVQMSGGAVKTEVLSSDEVEAIRKRSKAGSNGPWVSDWGEMAKKTAFRRCQKWLPLSAEIADAMDKDYDVIEGAPPAVVVQTIDEIGQMIGSMPEKQEGQQANGEHTNAATSHEEGSQLETESDQLAPFLARLNGCTNTASVNAAGEELFNGPEGEALSEADRKRATDAITAQLEKVSKKK